MPVRLELPENLNLDAFLSSYWQQRPLLMRNAIDPALLTFPAEELAGLACEEEVESRLIQQAGQNQWELQHGPLDLEVFSTLPEENWTLLVQDVDKHVPEVARLLDAFSFLPDWRLDDIMISYAANEGGVGPHTDNYDVFLIQAQGQRRWRLSEKDYADEDLLPDCPLRVLNHFDTDEDWTLNPGDVLYLPPRLAHWGTAVGECVTWSVGMRGPNQDELLDAWLHDHATQIGHKHFHDTLAPGRLPAAGITDDEFSLAQSLMIDMLPRNDAAFRRWFGAYVTEPKTDFEIAPLDQVLQADELRALVVAGQSLHRHPWARFACADLGDGEQILCSQGECHEVPAGLADALALVADQRHLASTELLSLQTQEKLWPWLCTLFNRGLLTFDD